MKLIMKLKIQFKKMESLEDNLNSIKEEEVEKLLQQQILEIEMEEIEKKITRRKKRKII